MSTIGIVGPDYCGSTLVNSILDGLPGVIGAGETHWVVDREMGCRECFKRPCPVFSDEVLAHLRSDDGPSRWWEVIGTAAKADVVVSADKRKHHYLRFGIPDRLVVLVKDPRAHIVSFIRRERRRSEVEEDVPCSDTEIEKAMQLLRARVFEGIEFARQSGKPWVVLALADLAELPEATLRTFCEWAGLPYDAAALRFWEREHHYIGSNHSVKRLKPTSYFYHTIKPDLRWRRAMTTDQADRVAAQLGAEIFSECRSQILTGRDTVLDRA